MTSSVSTGYPGSAQAAYGIIFLALLGFVLTTDITLTSLLIEPMKRDLRLTDVEVALVQGTAYGLALGVASLPMGRLIDSVSRRLLLAIGLGTWAVALCVIGLSGSLGTLIGGRMALGVVAALVVPAGFSMAADLFPPERRSVSTSLLVAGQALGQGCGILFGGLAFDALTRAGWPGSLQPWRTLYLAAALVGVVLILLLIPLREPRRQERRAVGSDTRRAIRELWSYRAFLVPLTLGLLFAQVTIQAAAIWASPMLIRRGLTPGTFAGWLGPVLLVGGILGSLAGGWLAEAGRRRAGRRGVLIPAAILAGLIAPASLFPLASSLALFGALLGAHVFAGAVAATIGVISITLVIPNEIRGLALGMNTFVAAVFGAAGAPAAVALISRALGGEQMLSYAFAALCIPAALLATLALILAARSRAEPSDTP